MQLSGRQLPLKYKQKKPKTLQANWSVDWVKHVYRHAAGKRWPGNSASVHNGRVGKNGGDRNQTALLGELGVSVRTTVPEPDWERNPEDEDEHHEKRTFLSSATKQEQPTFKPLFPFKGKRPQTTSEAER